MKPLKPIYKILYYVVFFIGWLLLRLVYPVRVTGRKNMKKGCFVLASNHIHAIDPLFIISAVGFGKKMLIMAKEELFRMNPLLNVFGGNAGAFPVDRGAGDKSLIDETVA